MREKGWVVGEEIRGWRPSKTGPGTRRIGVESRRRWQPGEEFAGMRRKEVGTRTEQVSNRREGVRNQEIRK